MTGDGYGAAKECYKCGILKPLNEFYNCKRIKDGKTNKCIECTKIDNHNNWIANKDEIKKQRKDRRKRDKEHIDKLEKESRIRNKESLKRGQKEYYIKNKDKKIAATKKYYVDHRDECIKKSIIRKNKSLEDPHNKMIDAIRKRLKCFIKNSNIRKIDSISKSLGCDNIFLVQYIESLFYNHPTTGEIMTWDNFGKWHLDHIIPLSKFNLEDKMEFQRACHYTNIQPLWAGHNLIKSDRIMTIGEIELLKTIKI